MATEMAPVQFLPRMREIVARSSMRIGGLMKDLAWTPLALTPILGFMGSLTGEVDHEQVYVHDFL